jgi:ATP-dependent DNA helicase RecQ
VGRAGRDGGDADCLLFYSWADVVAWDRMAPDDEEVAAAQRRQVRAMFRFADEGGCRHERLVGHFGEVVAPCGDAFDACTGRDPLAGLPRVGRMRSPRAGRDRPGRDRPGRRVAGSPGRQLEAEAEEAPVDLELFEVLRAWRAAQARANGVPAYVIFPDATLAEVAARRPRSEDDLAEVKGIGPKKLERYGAELLRLVRAG